MNLSWRRCVEEGVVAAFLKPIFNVAVESSFMQDRNQIFARCASPTRFLTSHTKKGDSGLKFAKKQAVFGLWVGMICAKLGLHTAGDEKLYLLVTGSLYLLTVRDCRHKTRCSDFEVRERWIPEFLYSYLRLNLYLC